MQKVRCNMVDAGAAGAGASNQRIAAGRGAAPDIQGQRFRYGVDAFDHLVQMLESDNRKHRSEDFLVLLGRAVPGQLT